jgi:hypothetical protein
MIIEIVILSSVIMGFLGSYVAKEKNRSGTEGFLLGLLFSLIGVIIVALLPTKEKQKEIVISDEEKEKLKREQEELMKKKDEERKEMMTKEDKVIGKIMLWGSGVLFLIFIILYLYSFYY